MNNKPKKTLTITLTAILLLLAIAVTGFGKPGFLLGILKRKPYERKLTPSQLALPEVREITGDSRAVSSDPFPYLHIEAPQNTFVCDTDIGVTELSFEKQVEYEQQMNCELGSSCVFYGAWDVDAGLENDALSPGAFTIRWDLEQIGVPEEEWQGMTAFYLDGSGRYHEYSTSLDGHYLSAQSNHNCPVFLVGFSVMGLIKTGACVIPAVACAADLIDSMAEKGSHFATFVADPESRKIQFRIEYTKSATVDMLENNLLKLEDKITTEERKMSQDEIIKEIKKEKGEDYEPQNNEIWKKKREMKDKKLNESAEYQDLLKKFKDAEQAFLDETAPYGAETKLRLVKEIGGRAVKAYNFLKSHGGGLKMPTDVITVKLVINDLNAQTVSPWLIGNPYIKIPMQDFEQMSETEALDAISCTLTHELFHVCQRQYKRATLANLKYDEATAQLVECDARDYFYTNRDILSKPESTEANHNLLQYFALPLDEYSVTYSTYSEVDKKDKQVEKKFTGPAKSDSGYPLAHFIEFLRNKYHRSITYHDLLKPYNTDIGTSSFTENIKQAFGLNDEAMELAYYVFARKMIPKFYEFATNPSLREGNCDWMMPQYTFDPDASKKVTVINHDFTIWLRKFTPQLPAGYSGPVSLLLTNDADFQTALSDVKIFPMNYKYKATRHGLLSDALPVPKEDYWIMEADGGTGDSGESASYNAYFLTAPEFTEPPVYSGGKLRFTLPEGSLALRDGHMDGFRVTIVCSDGTETIKHYKRSAALKTKTISVNKLISRATRLAMVEDSDFDVSFTVSVCEYINPKEPGGERVYGPEKNDLESAMESTLVAEGAMAGKITISLGWQTHDDLDLHVFTPDGSEIYYRNKEAGGGILDVDMQIGEPFSANPAEHVAFVEPQPGEYRVSVVTYTDRTEDFNTPFIVVVKIGDTYKKVYNMVATGDTEVCVFYINEEDIGEEDEDILP